MTESKYKQSRRMTTRWTVKAADKIAKFSITVGGIGTILAVSAVCVFLVAVVIPMFLPGNADEASEAVREVGPYGLDVCSGVRSDGRLDEAKLLDFFAAVGA